jgi:hypothetical protein
MFFGMAAPPFFGCSKLEGCIGVVRDPPFLFTGSYREAKASPTCPTIDFDDRVGVFYATRFLDVPESYKLGHSATGFLTPSVKNIIEPPAVKTRVRLWSLQ